MGYNRLRKAIVHLYESIVIHFGSNDVSTMLNPYAAQFYYGLKSREPCTLFLVPGDVPMFCNACGPGHRG